MQVNQCEKSQRMAITITYVPLRGEGIDHLAGLLPAKGCLRVSRWLLTDGGLTVVGGFGGLGRVVVIQLQECNEHENCFTYTSGPWLYLAGIVNPIQMGSPG